MVVLSFGVNIVVRAASPDALPALVSGREVSHQRSPLRSGESALEGEHHRAVRERDDVRVSRSQPGVQLFGRLPAVREPQLIQAESSVVGRRLDGRVKHPTRVDCKTFIAGGYTFRPLLRGGPFAATGVAGGVHDLAAYAWVRFLPE